MLKLQESSLILNASLIIYLILIVLVRLGNSMPVDLNYYGTINKINYFENTGNEHKHVAVAKSDFYDGYLLSVGDNFFGTLQYNSNTLLTSVIDKGLAGIYLNAVTEFGFSTKTWSLPSLFLPTANIGGDILVRNNGKFHGWDIFYISNWFSNSSWVATITLDLLDKDGIIYNDFSIPTEFNLNDFETLYFHMSFIRRQNKNQLHLYGNISTLTVVTKPTPVPEPPTVFLFGMGLVCLLYIKRINTRYK